MGLRWFKALGLRLRVFGFGISGLGLEILDFETLHLLNISPVTACTGFRGPRKVRRGARLGSSAWGFTNPPSGLS